MPDVKPFLRLSHEGALKMLNAAVAKATAMKVPQCICIVDNGGHLLAFVRMDGGNIQSFDTAFRKAQTSAANGQPSGGIEAGVDMKLAVATEGKRINLPGGLPIIVDGHVIGGLGVGSGTGAEDLEVANAGIAALAGAKAF
ncbi:MAG: heme-binding protein [Alphaproteobacteria bacterium]|nr:heme-binding protein [Alphaproteobacteria bacterium]